MMAAPDNGGVISKRTVLILGAGTSFAECGFPMGHVLAVRVRNLCRVPQSDANFGQVLHDCRISFEKAQKFGELIDDAGGMSIDELLESRSDYLDIGKIAIAYVLMPYEDASNMCKIDTRDKSWYAYLFRQMRAKFEEIHSNALTIVTFNYDRSLNVFLRRSLLNFYNRTTDDVERVMSSIPIIHVHGQLGSLTQNPYGRYNPQSVLNDHYIKAVIRAKNEIKIVHEV